LFSTRLKTKVKGVRFFFGKNRKKADFSLFLVDFSNSDLSSSELFTVKEEIPKKALKMDNGTEDYILKDVCL